MSKEYCGDVDLIIHARWRVSTLFAGRMTKAKMLEILSTGQYDEVIDEIMLEILRVVHIGANNE